MRIDLNIARNVGNDLKKYRAKMNTLHESMKKIHTELSAQDCEALEEELAEMYKKLEELEDEIVEINSLIVGLNGIITVYEKTEKKNTANVNGVASIPKGTAKDVVISVPDNISGLFR